MNYNAFDKFSSIEGQICPERILSLIPHHCTVNSLPCVSVLESGQPVPSIPQNELITLPKGKNRHHNHNNNNNNNVPK